jgi:hypothetical protein
VTYYVTSLSYLADRSETASHKTELVLIPRYQKLVSRCRMPRRYGSIRIITTDSIYFINGYRYRITCRQFDLTRVLAVKARLEKMTRGRPMDDYVSYNHRRNIWIDASSIQHVAESETLFNSDNSPKIVAAAIPRA